MKALAWLIGVGLVLSLVGPGYVLVAEPFTPTLNGLLILLGVAGSVGMFLLAGWYDERKRRPPHRPPSVKQSRPTVEEDRERRRRFREEVARSQWLALAPYRKILDDNLKARGREPVAWGDGPQVTGSGP